LLLAGELGNSIILGCWVIIAFSNKSQHFTI
jgi:hypothetical protein